MTTTGQARGARTQPSVARWRRVGLWALQAVAAVAMIGAGATTLAGAPQPVAMFEQIGLGDWFRYLTGVLQLVGGVGLLIPALCGLAAAGLVAMWLIAVAMHLLIIGGNPAPAVMFLVLSAVIAWERRDRTAALTKSMTGRGTR